jgi:hypothetical protein
MIFDEYNDNTYFFYDDKDKVPGLNKLPKALQACIGGFTLLMFVLINISFFKAAFTPAGSLPTDHEWDIREKTLNIFKHKNQLSKDLLDVDLDRVSTHSPNF